MPRTSRARATSVAKSRWVSATMISAPISFNSLTAAAAVSVTEAKATSGPGEDSTAVSGPSSPKKPTVKSPAWTVCRPVMPAAGLPSLPSTLVPSQGKSDSPKRCRAMSGPKSNSWLPGTATSMPMAFISSTIWLPLVRPDMTEGEIKSPPRVVMLISAVARSWRSKVISSAKPP